MPGYTLTLKAEEVALGEDLGWGLPMLRRLDALRTMLDGDAAKEMEFLLGRLSGLRAQWEKGGPAMSVAHRDLGRTGHGEGIRNDRNFVAVIERTVAATTYEAERAGGRKTRPLRRRHLDQRTSH